jgi:hypothetical protein
MGQVSRRAATVTAPTGAAKLPGHSTRRVCSHLLTSAGLNLRKYPTLLVAYHRDAVEALNRGARLVWEKLGRLSGAELEAPGGRRYRAGDRVVTLSPGRDGAWVTSQRAVVTSVDAGSLSLVAVTPAGAELHLGPDDIGADKLAHAYGVTAHRSQGQTVDVTYALEDGGGRELAYVAMSRARGESHVHVVAHDLTQAAQRLAWAWGQERRQAWVLRQSPEERLAHLYLERQELRASLPPDRSGELDDVHHRLQQVGQDAADLRAGVGRWAYSAPGQAARAVGEGAVEHQRATQVVEAKSHGLWARHKARRQLKEAEARFDHALEAWRAHGEPRAQQLDARRGQLSHELSQLEQAQRAREDFLARHPEVPGRLVEFDRAIEHQQQLERQRSWARLVSESTSGTSASRTTSTPASASTCEMLGRPATSNAG